MRQPIEVPIANVLDVVIDHRGLTPKKLGADWASCGVQVISAMNIKEGQLDTFITQRYVTPNVFERWMPEKLRRGDILMTSEAPLGAVAVFEEEGNFCLGQRLFALRAKPSKLDQQYFFWVLQAPLVQNRFVARSTGTTAKGIRQSELLQVHIPLPPIEEQRRIAAILDKADAVRRKRKEAIALTEELLRSAFLEMFGDPVTNPKGWEVVPFSQLVQGEMRNGLSPSNKGTYKGQVLTLSAITQGTFNSTQRKTAEFDVPPPKDKMVRKSDLLVCRGNGNINLVGCARFPDNDYKDVMFPDTIIGVPINSSLINSSYLETLWNSSSVRRQIEQQARTTNGTQKINQKVLNNIQILLPPIALQEKFGAFYHAIKAVSVRFTDSAPNDLFNSLLQRAFRGEL
ncbi:MAG: restriction endonuclease subunit S [Coleofasciculus sp. Co-bin14]|nr:restriction endonuclease subunit S [Coleofasciculus sp. Co-bin14]